MTVLIGDDGGDDGAGDGGVGGDGGDGGDGEDEDTDDHTAGLNEIWAVRPAQLGRSQAQTH